MRAITVFESRNPNSTIKYLSDEKKLPKNIKHRLSDEYGRKPTKIEEEAINKTKKYIMILPDGCKVYFVDTKPIRDIQRGGPTPVWPIWL